jgi:hypothetical protein
MLPANAIANPSAVVFTSNSPNSTVLTVAGILQTPLFTLKARTAGAGSEVSIAQGGTIAVTNTLYFSAGNISGAGTLLVPNPQAQGTTAYVLVGATQDSNANDMPTLGALLQLGGALPGAGGGGAGAGQDGGGPGGGGGVGAGNVLMEYDSAPGQPVAAQPLVVVGSAAITVNANARIEFDGLPLQRGNIATAIGTGDAGTETITVNNGGVVHSDGAYERTVAMGVQLNIGGTVTGDLPAGQETGSALHFTGEVLPQCGLQETGGTLVVQGAVTFDQGADISGGTVQLSNGTLTLGQIAASPPSYLTGGTISLAATLVAHGGFNMSGGTLDASGAPDPDKAPHAITMDAGNVFQLSGGTIFITQSRSAVGYLSITGNFLASGGLIVDNVSTVGEIAGLFEVFGNATLSEQCTWVTQDVAPQAGQSTVWALFDCTGAGSGSFSFFLPTGWTYWWNNWYLEIDEPG